MTATTFLQQLFEGEIYPMESCYPRTEEYVRLKNQYREMYEHLLQVFEKLDPPQDKLFDAYDEVSSMMAIQESAAQFAEGFRLGARMMMEVLAGEEKT